MKTANRELILDALQEVVTTLCIENPEAVRKWGDLSDWHHAIGTGPFILKEFIPMSKLLWLKIRINWGHDERYPQNKLPYFRFTQTSDNTRSGRSFAEMRAGRIDVVDQITPMLAHEMRKTTRKYYS